MKAHTTLFSRRLLLLLPLLLLPLLLLPLLPLPLLLSVLCVDASAQSNASLQSNSVRTSPRDPDQKAKLTGTVTDASTGERLIGVTVFVEGTKAGAKTNIDGKFSIQIDPSIYNVKISYVGYKSKMLENVKVIAGEVKRIEVVLEQASVTGDEVIVTSKIATESATAQLLERKKAATMNDVLGAEQIRRAPDATSGDAIKRISGVTISDNKFVNIRGTNERYNNALLNGTVLTSTEPDKKAFSFDLLPSNLLDNTIVTKTFTPDLPANFSGGLVQLNTVNFPDKLTAKISISASRAYGTTGKDFATYQTGATDWLAYDDGTRSLPVEVPTNMSLRDSSIQNNPDRITSISRSFRNNWTTQRTIAPINANIALSLGDAFEVFDNEFGYIATFSYKNSYQHTGIVRNSYALDGNAQYLREGVKDSRSVLWGGLVNVSYKLSPTDILSFKNIYDRSADDEVLEMQGVDSVNFLGHIQNFTSLHYIERTLMSNQLSGEHSLVDLGPAGFGKLRLDWRLSRAATTRNEPDLRRYVYDRDPDMDLGSYMLLGTANPAYGGRFFSGMQEKNYEGGLDLTLPVQNGKIKFGGVIDSRTRDFSARVFGIKTLNNSNFHTLYEGIDSIFRPENMGTDFAMEEITNPEDKYDASEHVTGLYAMIDAPFTIGSQQFRTIAGARLERSSQNLNTSHLAGTTTGFSNLHTDVLPSLSLVYSVTDQINLRAAWSHTLSRPEFREIAPFAFYDFEIGSMIQGDTNIDRALIRSLDFRAEYYPTAGELVSASIFHKRFGLSNELFGLLYPEFQGGAIEQTNVGSNSYISWANTTKPAINYGFELEIRKNLGFIDNYLTGLVVSGNFSRVFSKVDVRELSAGLKDERPMQGQSPYTLNLGVLFSEPTYGTTLNVLYNTNGRRITEVSYIDDDLYELPRKVLDVSLSQPIGSNYELKYTAKDVTAQDQVFMRGEHIERVNRRMPVHALSVSIKL